MINAWSLLYDELYGDDEMTDKTYPIDNNEIDTDINITTGTGNTATYSVPDSSVNDFVFPSGTADDTISITGGDFIDFTSPEYSVDTLNLDFSGIEGINLSAAYSDDVITFGDTTTPGIEDQTIESIKKMSPSKLSKIIFLPLMVDIILPKKIMSKHLI